MTWPRNGAGSRSIRSVRLPAMPASSAPSAAAQTRSTTFRLVYRTTTVAAIARAGQADGEAGAERERRARVAGEVELEEVADDSYVVPVGQVLDRGALGELVGDVEDDRDEREDEPRPTAGQHGPPVAGRAALAAAYRRSSRCLHVRHIVARGNAINRILPMALPHDSHTP